MTKDAISFRGERPKSKSTNRLKTVCAFLSYPGLRLRARRAEIVEDGRAWCDCFDLPGAGFEFEQYSR